MKATWTIADHHLALTDGTNVYHPDASEIYRLTADGRLPDGGLECRAVADDLPGVRLSRIGAPMFIRLTGSEEGGIALQVVALRGGREREVDVVDGTVIDHCMADGVWFFLTNERGSVQDALTAAGIKANGPVTMRQYFKLAERAVVTDARLIDNEVPPELLRNARGEASAVPQGLKATLFPYQQDGFRWISHMLEECGGCILGDEMGLGKTMQVIAEMLHLKGRGAVPMLVVAPVSLLANWQREIERFAPSLRTCVHHGAGRTGNYRRLAPYNVVITSYTTVVSDLYMLNMLRWQLVALDEAQNVKSPASARTRACKQLARERSIAVTGTPFENHVTDIWSILDFVLPGLVGSLGEYVEAIPDDVEGGRRIEAILSPLMMRRLVADVAQDLPEKVVATQPLRMSEAECTEYGRMVDALKAEAGCERVSIAMLQQLRIYCTHPYAANGLPEAFAPRDVSVKYERLCELVEEIVSRGEKVIVFTSYKRMFSIFQRDIPSRFGIPLWCINGDTPVDERQATVDRFNTLPMPAMLVLNPRAAGTGLNITGANHVVHYNREWNPALEAQSSARAYRRGQRKTVFVYRLYYADTVEQVVNERIERKRDIATTAVVGNNGGNPDRADIERALTLVPKFNTQ